MHKLISFIVMISISFMVGCYDSTKFDHDDVAANVRGEEITVGDVRFFMEVEDEGLPDKIETFVEETLIIQEAKEMDIDVMKEVELAVETHSLFPFQDEEEVLEDSRDFMKKERDFAEAQADRFDMEPKEYYKEYIKKGAVRQAYIYGFFDEHMGDHSPETEEDVEKINEKYQLLLNELLEENDDEIEILIK
ncbi:hypothetical protein [Alkalibacillus haloalkaliphilus]|uniref:hypothetical protein n=1 Tax=Alkalibacillus haloalkaliphilus TaxID=94136 RepID=UPI002936767E|nr:hypothetical protein [Alkalibacillus haloalkaliphilus]MDV2582727.1 hypothetical protein [Alkalibacillus haloalkaliphilus]